MGAPESVARRALARAPRPAHCRQMARVVGCVCLSAALLWAAWSAPAAASIGEALDLAALVHASDAIVVAKATGKRAYWDDGQIFTDVTLQVEQALEGRRGPGETLVVSHLGGEVGRIGMRVEGMPRFEIGKRALVFAKHGRVRSGLWPVGMAQGVLPVRRRDGRDMVLPGGRGMVLVQRGGGGKLLTAPGALLGPRPLSEVLLEVRALVAREHGR